MLRILGILTVLSAGGFAAAQPPAAGLRALDADHDGQLSAEEIEGAGEALKSLDEDGDGVVTRDELRPSADRPGRGEGRGPRGREGFGPPAGAERRGPGLDGGRRGFDGDRMRGPQGRRGSWGGAERGFGPPGDRGFGPNMRRGDFGGPGRGPQGPGQGFGRGPRGEFGPPQGPPRAGRFGAPGRNEAGIRGPRRGGPDDGFADAMFERLDADSDGSISKEEFLAGRQRMRPNPGLEGQVPGRGGREAGRPGREGRDGGGPGRRGRGGPPRDAVEEPAATDATPDA